MKADRENDPKYQAMKVAAKQQRQENYQAQKARKQAQLKAANTLAKKAKAEIAHQRRQAKDAALMEQLSIDKMARFIWGYQNRAGN
ncbi:MAG: hypothetical protein GY822_00395 [Deltaproteobacteria bacterium]|nr:hypothetical protein [Deltaproteobacteria bacterium]